ncbi:hypothetical protein FBU59_005929, partial [Linderina macrospora]
MAEASPQKNPVDLTFEGFDTTNESEALSPNTPSLGMDLDEELGNAQNDELVKQVLTKGVDLRQYSRQIEQELHDLEDEQLASYEQHESELLALDAEIKSCDE